MSDKDFLSQFSNNDKPDSFKEEERIKVTKEKKPINKPLLIGGVVGTIILSLLAYLLFFAPKIEVPNFVGRSRNDLAAWVKQQNIEVSGIIIDEIYDFDNDEGTILSQSIPEGKKVKENMKANFTVSLGPDPNEKIVVPNLNEMDKNELQKWVDDNKLTKTKIVTAYSDDVAENEVIDYAFTGTDEDNFTRAGTLRINVSKGPQPAGKVTVEDFEKKIFETVEQWAKSKKINLTKTEVYSDKVDAGYVISQSVESGKTIEEGDTLNVVVSKGKAVYMVNMIGWNEKQLDSWQRKNLIEIYKIEQYSDMQKGIILSQSISSGSLIEPEDYLEVKISKGNIVDLDNSFVNQEYHDIGGLHDWKDKQNEIGANITVNRIFEFSDTVPANHIISHDMSVEVGGTLNAIISKGRNILLKDGDVTWRDLANGSNVTEEQARKLCEANNFSNYEIHYIYKEGLENGYVVSANRWDYLTLASNTYLPEYITLYIYINDLSLKE